MDSQEIKNGLDRVFGGMSGARRSKIYFGEPPKNAYFGFNKDIVHIHDLTMSEGQKRRLYGLGNEPPKSTGDFINTRLETDSRADLIRELCENSNMTRAEASNLIDRWMIQNNLVEENGPFGKIIKAKE